MCLAARFCDTLSRTFTWLYESVQLYVFKCRPIAQRFVANFGPFPCQTYALRRVVAHCRVHWTSWATSFAAGSLAFGRAAREQEMIEQVIRRAQEYSGCSVAGQALNLLLRTEATFKPVQLLSTIE
jgi:hypothetical protein